MRLPTEEDKEYLLFPLEIVPDVFGKDILILGRQSIHFTSIRSLNTTFPL